MGSWLGLSASLWSQQSTAWLCSSDSHANGKFRGPMCFECNEPCQGTSPRKTAHVITDLLRQNFITASAQTITRGRGTQNKQLRNEEQPTRPLFERPGTVAATGRPPGKSKPNSERDGARRRSLSDRRPSFGSSRCLRVGLQTYGEREVAGLGGVLRSSNLAVLLIRRVGVLNAF